MNNTNCILPILYTSHLYSISSCTFQVVLWNNAMGDMHPRYSRHIRICTYSLYRSTYTCYIIIVLSAYQCSLYIRKPLYVCVCTRDCAFKCFLVCVIVCVCVLGLLQCWIIAFSPLHNTGAVPYLDLSNQEVVTKVIAGYRMKQPSNCSEKM